MIDDAFRKNKVVARYRATGTWTSSTALHPGGEADESEASADMVLLRSTDGSYFIPGSSIAGAARSYLAGIGVGRDEERKELTALFGGSDYGSLLTVFDAVLCEGAAQILPYIRDGVCVNASTGIAEDGFKYNFEVLPAGTKFKFEFQLVVYEKNPKGVDGDSLLECFKRMLAALASGEVRLGARTNRGLGKGTLVLDKGKIFRIDMRNPEHVRFWLARTWDKAQGILMALPQASESDVFRIDAKLVLKTSLLIRSAGEDAAVPDMVHLKENGYCLLPGTSLAGVFRQRCLRIANTMGLDGGAITESMFGPLPDPERHKKLWASRVRVEENALPGTADNLHVQGRVSIDRFTGGALESHLFDQAAFWPAVGDLPIHIVVELRPPQQGQPFADHERALLMQAFKDLWLGDLTIGGEAGVGRGVFEGVSASFSCPNFEPVSIEATKDGISLKGKWEEWGKIAALPNPEGAHV